MKESSGKDKKYVMVIDLRKCLGCKTCTIACNIENSVLTTNTWNIVFDTIKGWFPDYVRQFLPRPCLHCSEPPCVEVCPTGASHIREGSNIVLVDYDKCIGCRYCMTACPYEARVFNWRKPEKPLTENPAARTRIMGVVEKCTFCIQRIRYAEKYGLYIGSPADPEDTRKTILPACVDECIGEARYFGDLNDPSSEVSQLIAEEKYKLLVEDLGTEPNVYYLGAKMDTRGKLK